MPTLEQLTEADIKKVVNNNSYRRARGYSNAIRNPVRSGKTLTAKVQGTFLYDVEIDVDNGGIYATCSCPYGWVDYCKHVGAVLLKWLQAPSAFDSRTAVSPATLHGLEVIPVEPPPTQRPDTQPDWLQNSLEDRQAAERQQMEEWLNVYRLPDLRALAKNRGWSLKGARKDDVVQQLLDHMMRLGDHAKAIYSLDEEHRHVLRAIALLTGEEGPVASDLERVVRFFGPFHKSAKTETYASHLVHAGLAVSRDVQFSYPPRTDFVPRFLARHFPPLLETVIPAMPDLSSNHPVSEVRLADVHPFMQRLHQLILLLEQSVTPLRDPMPRPRLETFYDALQYWDYDPQELFRVIQTKQLDRRAHATLTVPPPAYTLPDDAIERLAPVAGDAARLEFMYALLLATGVVQPGSPVTLWADVKEAFLRRDEATQHAILARAYFDMTTWNELWDLLRTESDLQLRRTFHDAYLTPDEVAQALAVCRHLVLRVLAHLPDNRWIVLDDLRPLLRTVWPRFDELAVDHSQAYSYRAPSQPDHGNWFLARQGHPLDPKREPDWELGQWNFVRMMLTGPLHWLGLADLCGIDRMPVAVRFHGLSDLYWDRDAAARLPGRAGTQRTTGTSEARTAPAAPSENGAIRIEGDRIQVRPSALSVHAHNLLDKIATLDVATADQFLYQLDVQSAHATFESGVALADIESEWAEQLPCPMPETVRDRLATWWDAYGQVRVYDNVTLIEFGDDYALAEMKAVTSLDHVLIAEISPRLVLIPQKTVPALMDELEKAGYTPKHTTE